MKRNSSLIECQFKPLLVADDHVLEPDEFPLLTFPGGVSSAGGKMNELDDTLPFKRVVELGESIDSNTPTRNKERCFFKSANVHAPPDNEGTGYRTAGKGEEDETGNVTGSGNTDDTLVGGGGTNRPPFIVFIVTET